MTERKVIEQRTCVGCRTVQKKAEMIRLVRIDGIVSIDRSGKGQGRGAYLCPRLDCLEKARKKKSLNRTLKVAVEEEIYERLKGLISEKDSALNFVRTKRD